MIVTAPHRTSDGRTLAVALGLVLSFGVPALAEPGSSAPRLRLAQAEAPAAGDGLKQREQELEAIQAEQQRAAETETKLRREIEAIGDDRRALNQQLIDTAARLREVEGRLTATEARVQPLDAREQTIRSSLDSRRAVIAEVLAALQRVGRRPPPALMVRPEDALESVRTAILLGAVVPEMRGEAMALSTDLADLVRVRKEIADERERLSRDLAALAE
jgi:septal ring factor EnvC (AmiA/AmiB activator)